MQNPRGTIERRILLHRGGALPSSMVPDLVWGARRVQKSLWDVASDPSVLNTSTLLDHLLQGKPC